MTKNNIDKQKIYLQQLAKALNKPESAKNYELLCTLYNNNIIDQAELPTLLYLNSVLARIEVFKTKYKTLEDDINIQKNPDDIDTSKLLPGMEVKNYKTLCELINQKPVTGRSKSLQLQRWKRYFDFEKLTGSQSFIILEIYDEPLPKNTKYRKSKFVNELKVLILTLLTDEKLNNEGTITYTTSYTRLIKDLNLLNKYAMHANEMEVIQKFFTTNHPNLFFDSNVKWNVKFFCSTIFRKVKSNLTYALTALKKDNMISFETFNIISAGNITHRATDDEESLILKAKKEVAVSMGFSNSRDACFYQQTEFYKRFHSYIKDNFEWDDVFFKIKIISNKDVLTKHICEYTALDDKNNVHDLTKKDVNSLTSSFHLSMFNVMNDLIDETPTKKINAYKERFLNANPNYKSMGDDLIYKMFIKDASELKNYDDDFVQRQHILNDYLAKNDDELLNEIALFIEKNRRHKKQDLTNNSIADFVFQNDELPEFDFLGDL